jgi:hypothetical protein
MIRRTKVPDTFFLRSANWLEVVHEPQTQAELERLSRRV